MKRPQESDVQRINREAAKQRSDHRLEETLRRRPELLRDIVVENKMVTREKETTK